MGRGLAHPLMPVMLTVRSALGSVAFLCVGDGDGDEWRTRGIRCFADKDRKNPRLREFTMRHRTQVNSRTAIWRSTTNQTALCAYNYVDMFWEVSFIFGFAVAK